MIRHRIEVILAVIAVVLATGMSITPQEATSPTRKKILVLPAVVIDSEATDKPLLSADGYTSYLVDVLKAEDLKDPVQRCLAYPSLPGSDWPTAMVDALCALIPPEGSLDELDKVLKQPDGGAALDRRYAALLDANYAGPKQKDRIFRAYEIFDHSTHAAAVAQEWVRQSPDSAYARTARAWQLVASGWEARGAKFASETPRDQLGSMEDDFAHAIPDLAFALKQNPKLLPACDRLISIGASINEQLQTIGSTLCLKADPASYRVMKSLLWAAQPKWGGSQEQMRALVAIARAHEADNPALAALRNYQAGYESAAGGEYTTTGPTLERVSSLSPGYLEDTSRAMINLNRSWDAIVYASQAIRFHEDEGEAYYDRANAFRKLNAFELVIADAKRAKELGSGGGWPDVELTIGFYFLNRPLESREHAIEAMNHPKTRQTGYEYVCRSYWSTHELDKMADCAEKLVIDYPGDDEAWRLRAVAYKDAKNPRMYDAVDDFLQRADPKGQASEITWFKAWQLKNPRPDSAASVPEPTSKSALKP